VPAAALRHPAALRATRLTAADDRLKELATALRGTAFDGPGWSAAAAVELATRIFTTVHCRLRYEYGVTSIWTTAAEALAGGRGVCQDAAHIMLALCQLVQLSARYVSGHLLGQGGTHAWVEVLVARDGYAVALPFDPCNGVAGSARYLTIATGRDYTDVPPTSGTFVGADGGRLTSQRRVGIIAAA
jgi:transglutaminase-like putative cysteine protease